MTHYRLLTPRTAVLCLLIVFVIISGWFGSPLIANMKTISEVTVSGSMSQPQQTLLEDLAGKLDLQEMSIRELKDSFESISWVDQADILRDWPGKIEARITPRKIIALWNDRDYLDNDGSVFTSPFPPLTRLPQLYGPEGAEQEVMRQYQQLSRTLMLAGESIDTLTLSERGAWQYRSTRGVEVQLGKENIRDRLQRYLKIVIATRLYEKEQSVAAVDTRYPNGIAVRWHGVEGDNLTIEERE